MSVPLYPPTADTLAALPAGKAPVLVVGIVGSSSCASSLLAERISDARTFCGRGAAGRAPGSDGGTDGSTADVEFHHDAPRGMIYVHIAADLAMPAAEARAELMGLEGRDAEGVHAWLIYRSHRRIRALLLAFHVCDVLVLASNATCADFGMLRDLRLLHSLKQSAVPALSAAHRAASPTALKPPKPTVPVLGLLFGAPRAAGAADAEACAEKLEAALDAQLRKLLTSSKALARCSAAGTSALFVLPSATCAHVQRPVLALMPSDASVDAAPELFYDRLLRMIDDPPRADADASRRRATAKLRRFICDLAADVGECNLEADGAIAVGTAPGSAPRTADTWSAHTRLLLEHVFKAEPSAESTERTDGAPTLVVARIGGATLGRLCDVDSGYSGLRCSAALSAARDLYLRGLPAQYTRQVHESRLALAEGAFGAGAVGPAYPAALERLRGECAAIWLGRRLCDARSLTGRPCTLPMHELPGEARTEGIAAASGLLRVGDRIASVNGKKAAGHATTTALLKAAVGDVALRVRRPADAVDEALRTVTLHKPAVSSRLGIVLTSQAGERGEPTITGLAGAAGRERADARPHSSGYTCTHACHCGRNVRAREDPFTADEAGAYHHAECCASAPHDILRLAHRRGARSAAAPLASAQEVAEADLSPAWSSVRVTMREAETGGRDGVGGGLGGCACLLEQPGVLSRFSALVAAAAAERIDRAAAAEDEHGTTSRADGAPRPGDAEGIADGAESIATAALGIEYECAQGHRFLCPPGAPPGKAPRSGAPRASATLAPLSQLLAEETPLTRPCVGEGCGECAQLQRLHVRTPPATGAPLMLCPAIRFAPLVAARGADDAPDARPADADLFECAAPLALPPDRRVCVCLPHIYAPSVGNGCGDSALLTLATAAEPSLARQAVLLPHWLSSGM